MSFRYELACKEFSAEKAQHLVTLQNDICCFIGQTFALSLNLSHYNIYAVFSKAKSTINQFCWYFVLLEDGECRRLEFYYTDPRTANIRPNSNF